jgi:cytochrome c
MRPGQRSLTIFLLFLLFVLDACNRRTSQPRVLLFSRPAGLSAPISTAGWQAILKLGSANNFAIDTTSDIRQFREDTLKKYSAVVFLSAPGNWLDNYGQADFERYIQSGGGYAGVRAATESRFEWGWYRRLTGITDVLRTTPRTQDYDGGRAWCLDSLPAGVSFGDTSFLRQLLVGIQYAIGNNDQLNYNKAVTLRVPDEERFAKTSLTEGEFFEPTEMTILPNLDILVTQRRGEILLYKQDTKKVKQAGFLDVYFKTVHTPHVNAEEGVLGIQADPDFVRNHFVYIYYSPSDTSVNRLSRFTLSNDSIDKKSEKIVLEVKADREICCHTGGSIAFGPGNTLFVSTGDNSTPFDEPNTPYPSHGFAPLDDRPGHFQYDSRRGAGNTNDLRGKILRIKIKPDGSYEIPDGNLFSKGAAKTRPEIYIMGDRNPYRIAVDKKNGFLYWGEVGPDANNDSLDSRGPRGYDEVNQARKAGFFGWPLFVGDNYAYHLHDYAADVNGAAFDAAKPVNDSRNNTGLRELPPAQPAFIWYPYAVSPEFPELGSGGRCAMAGPVFYTDLYPEATRMPDYYNGKFFMYDWVRGWFKAVTLQPDGDLDKIEPFMEHTKFNAPVDVEMGPDGKIYVLEYGNGWFTKNPDAGIFRLDYNGGNMAPKVSAFSVDKRSGLLPLKVAMNVKAKDVENDSLRYVWDPGDGHKKETNSPTLEYTYTRPGDYALSVEVIDAKNASSRSEVINIYAGNATPAVNVQINGNQSFYFPGEPVNYSVKVDDPADTAGSKNWKDLVVSANYAEGTDKAASSQGHQVLSSAAEGKNIMLSLDCKTCHQVDEKSIGPAFTDVAKRYEKDPDMVSSLLQKITKGGSGKWGEVAMPAHPALKEEDIRSIIGWIQSLSAGNKTIPSLPAAATVDPTMHQPVKDNGVLTISASYTNKGGDQIRPLTGSGSASLQNSKVSFRKMPGPQGSVHKGHLDLSTITGAELGIIWGQRPGAAYGYELRLDSTGGKKIGSFDLKGAAITVSADKKQYTQTVKTRIEKVKDGQFHTIYLLNTGKVNELPAAPVSSLYIRFFNR